MKYLWPFLAATVALSIGSLAGAQSADERKALGRSINQTELEQLGIEFQNNFNAQELRVQAYLARRCRHEIRSHITRHRICTVVTFYPFGYLAAPFFYFG